MSKDPATGTGALLDWVSRASDGKQPWLRHYRQMVFSAWFWTVAM